ncbi:MAG TPA: hypothetical protein DCY88_17735 [Cyanobacteria bacterium UBA11372]|nr:hypothetical protein [Cyanobacteria bacterium UBA11372]
MKLTHSAVVITVLSFATVLSIQPSTYARTWACRNLGIGCPQTIRGTSPNPPSPPEPVGFRVCNNSSTNPIYVAYTTKRIGRFGSNGAGASTITNSQGWWNLRSGQCQVIYTGNASDVVAVYAQGSGRIWGNSYQYCIHPTNPFTFNSEVNYSSSECRSRGGRMVPFFTTGNASSFFTFTFN